MIRNEFCLRSWVFIPQNKTSNKIDLTEFSSMKDLFIKNLGKDFKSAIGPKSVVDNYKGLEIKKESSKGKIVFDVLLKREASFERKARLRSYLNMEVVPLDKIDKILDSFPLGLCWINPIEIEKATDSAYRDWNDTHPLSAADLLLVRKLYQKANKLKLRLSGYPEIMTTRALSRITTQEFGPILEELYNLLKGIHKDQGEMKKRLLHLISLTENKYRQNLMKSEDQSKFLKGVFGVKKPGPL